MVHKLCFVFWKKCSLEIFASVSVKLQLGLMEVSTEQTLGLKDVFFLHDRFFLSFFFFRCLGSLAGKNPPLYRAEVFALPWTLFKLKEDIPTRLV